MEEDSKKPEEKVRDGIRSNLMKDCIVFYKERKLKNCFGDAKKIPDIIAVSYDGCKVYVIECKHSKSNSLRKLTSALGQILIDRLLVEECRENRSEEWTDFLKKNIEKTIKKRKFNREVNLNDDHKIIYGIGLNGSYENSKNVDLIKKIKGEFNLEILYHKTE